MLTFSRAGFSSITGQAAYIVAGARTPIGVMMGKLSKFQATELGALAVQGALARGSVKPESVDEVILGNVCGAGLG
jgi:acetyl-CoA C-acetyltransferase